MRVEKSAGSTSTVYIFSRSHVIAEYDNGAASGSTGIGEAVFSYDAMGRTVIRAECTVYTCGWSGYTTTATYDLAGDLTSYSSPWTTFSQQFDGAGRSTSLTSNLVDSQHPATLATVSQFYPTDQTQQMSYGNGLSAYAVIEPRLQDCQVSLNSTGATLAGCGSPLPAGNVQTFGYVYGNWGSTNSGDATWTSGAGQQNFNRNYSYDSLNRLSSMSDPGEYTGCTGVQWSYDAWGNRTAQSVTGGSCPSAFTASFSQNTNRMDNYSYDASGNLLNDGQHSYTYDAENRITKVDGGNTATYYYDADGNRVEKVAGGVLTDYVYDVEGRVMAEANQSGWQAQYARLGGQLVAEYKNSTTYFIFADHLASTRVVTNVSGGVVDNMDYMPFGELFSGGSSTTHKFTGKERDSESGLDNFGARYNSSSLGRFMSPDPLAGHTEDPQTLNRYVYVRDNPLSLTDPTGLDFYLSCQTASNTCGKDAAGNLVQGTTTTTTDANGHTSSTFNATVVTSASLQDPNSGNTATVNQNGVQITTTDANGNKSTAGGIFINNTPAANVQGSGDLSGFAFNINSSNEKIGTLDAGTYTYEGSRNQADVIKILTDRGAFSYPGENSIGNPWHPGDLNFRFSSGAHPELFDYGPSPHLLVPTDPRATVPAGPGYPGQFHVDSHTGAFSHGSCAIFHAGCQ